ncbi:MAG TPA: carboxymuconolactone decarboxylase family protein [Candidatus Nanopelagicaceae bacterium]|nr:carboxymuconolactone decarboxylase family protein [Candidatus Nanopelagicaceae bacterium]
MNVEHGHLTTLNLLTTDTAPVGSRAILESTEAKLGMVPNLYAEMAHSPGLFGTYRLGYDSFRGDSGFDATEQEIVLLAISRFHVCTYCVAVHSVVADRNKVPVEFTDAIRSGKPIPDPKLQVLNAFTTAMLATRGRPSSFDLEQFVAAGYSEKKVLEIILAIAVKTISNYTNHVFDTPLDAGFSHRAWTPTEAN